MRFFLLFALLLLPRGALADAAYSSGSRLCASAKELKAPPAPGPACITFQKAHGAIIAYARETIASCMQADQRVSALKESLARGCAPAPGSDGCGQAMVAAESDYSEIERSLSGVRSRHERPVIESFPSAGQRISSGCLPLLESYQEFVSSVSSAVNDSVRVVQGERAELRQKVNGLLKQRAAAAK